MAHAAPAQAAVRTASACRVSVFSGAHFSVCRFFSTLQRGRGLQGSSSATGAARPLQDATQCVPGDDDHHPPLKKTTMRDDRCCRVERLRPLRRLSPSPPRGGSSGAGFGRLRCCSADFPLQPFRLFRRPLRDPFRRLQGTLLGRLHARPSFRSRVRLLWSAARALSFAGALFSTLVWSLARYWCVCFMVLLLSVFSLSSASAPAPLADRPFRRQTPRSSGTASSPGRTAAGRGHSRCCLPVCLNSRGGAFWQAR